MISLAIRVLFTLGISLINRVEAAKILVCSNYDPTFILCPLSTVSSVQSINDAATFAREINDVPGTRDGRFSPW